MNYSILAVTATWERWDSPSHQLVKLRNQQMDLRKEDSANLLRTLFPGWKVVVPNTRKGQWGDPYIKFKELTHEIQIKFTDNGYLQITYSWGHKAHTKMIRRLKITRQGNSDLIDGEKAVAAAAAIIAQRKMQLERVADHEDYKISQSKKDRAAFAEIRLSISISFSEIFNDGTGGIITLSNGDSIKILGNTARLKTDSTIHPSLVKEFVKLFEINSLRLV